MADGAFLNSIPEVTPQLAVSAYNVLRDYCRYHDCKSCPFWHERELKVNGCYFTQVGVPNDWRDMDG